MSSVLCWLIVLFCYSSSGWLIHQDDWAFPAFFSVNIWICSMYICIYNNLRELTRELWTYSVHGRWMSVCLSVDGSLRRDSLIYQMPSRKPYTIGKCTEFPYPRWCPWGYGEAWTHEGPGDWEPLVLRGVKTEGKNAQPLKICQRWSKCWLSLLNSSSLQSVPPLLKSKGDDQ